MNPKARPVDIELVKGIKTKIKIKLDKLLAIIVIKPMTNKIVSTMTKN